MSTSIVFIDSRVADIDTLIAGLADGTEWFLLNPEEDGVLQMAEILSRRSGLSSIHVVAHGSEGTLYLGSTVITSENLDGYESQLRIIGGSLSETGDILLYGCNVAQGNAGIEFIDALASITGADVAASNDPTGAASLNGNWILEQATGSIEAVGIDGGAAASLLAVNAAPTFIVAPGMVSTPIGTGDDQAYGIAVQADGKIVLAGFSYNGAEKDFALVRYNANGSLDTGFSGDGKLTTDLLDDDTAYDVIVQSDGKIVATGDATLLGYGNHAFARYNIDGSLDTAFSDDGMSAVDIAYYLNADSRDDNAYAIAQQGSGKLLAAGYYDYLGQDDDFSVVSLNADGSLNTAFGYYGVAWADLGGTINPGTNDQGKSIAIQSDGKILVAGYATKSSTSTNEDVALVRFTTSGVLDTTFSGDGMLTTAIGSYDDYGYSVAVQSDGKILVGGYYVASVDAEGFANYDFVVLRYTSSGTLDTTFSDDGKATASFGANNDIAYNGMVVQSDGKILLGGYTYNGTNYDYALVRFTSTGALDTTFSGDGKLTTPVGFRNDYAFSIALQADGKILLGGYSYDDRGETNDFALVRYNADGTLDRTFGPQAQTLDGTPVFTEDGAAVVLDGNVQIFDADLAALGNYAGATLTLARNGGANTTDRFSAAGSLFSLVEGQDLVVAGTAIGTVTKNSGGILSLTFNTGAKQDLMDKALQSIAYSNTSNAPPATAKIDWIFNDGNSGAQGTGGALAVTGSTVVTIVATNDAIPAYYGTSKSNELQGTAEADRLFALAGDDTLRSFGGNDFLDGGEGNDELFGGPGVDRLLGGLGADTLDGGAGNDRLEGGDGFDQLDHQAGAGNDTLIGGSGGDIFNIYSGNSANAIVIQGGTEGDLIEIDMVAASSSDTIAASGGSGVDTYSYWAWALKDDAGFNRLADLHLPVITVSDFVPGAGGDRIATEVLLEISASGARGYTGGNPFSSAQGYLRLVQNGSDAELQYDLDGTSGSHGFETILVLTGVSAGSLTADNFFDGIAPDGSPIAGRSLQDTANVPGRLIGGYGNDTLLGNWGDDTLIGLGGADSLDGGQDEDWLYGGAGNDTLNGGTGGVSGDSSDTLDGGLGNDSADGGDGDDRLVHRPGEGSDTLTGGIGNDRFEIDIAGLAGIAEHVVAYGGDGTDTFLFGLSGSTTTGTIRITGGTGRDFYAFDNGNAVTGGLTVTDFTPGATGDLIMTEFLINASATGGNGYVGGNPFNASLGYMRLVQSSSDTLFQWDRDGLAGTDYAFQTVMVLQGVTPTALTASNFAEGFAPNGTETAGVNTPGTSSGEILLGTYANDTILGNAGNDSIIGSSGSDSLNGGDGNDQIFGNAGNDTLVGSTGNDTLWGGAGNDSVSGGAGQDFMDHLSGEGNDTLSGGTEQDVIVIDHGNFPADGETVRVYGGGDADTLRISLGGSWTSATSVIATGDDNPTVREQDVYEYVNYDGTANAPTLTITDFNAGASGDLIDVSALLEISATGNSGYSIGSPFRSDLGYLRIVQSGANALLQYDQDGVLGSAYGFRTLIKFQNTNKDSITSDNFVGKLIVGTEDPDILTGDWGNDTIQGLGGNDTLSGIEGSDIIDGGLGDDILDGGLGGDDLKGDAGNDVYWVDDVLDVVTEFNNIPASENPSPIDTGLYAGVRDTVNTSINFSLGAYLENLVQIGSANLTGVGNELRNDIAGNDGNNLLRGLGDIDTLSGGLGADTLEGGAGGDILDGGAGTDTAEFSDKTTAVSLTLNGANIVSVSVGGVVEDTLRNIENVMGGTAGDTLNGDGLANVLSGGAGNDTLVGSTGNDTLDGGTGDDSLNGGGGNDTYLVDSLADTLTDASGIDTVKATLDWTLAASTENLVLVGTASLKGTGNGLSNSLTGNAQHNTLSGGQGNDTLVGGSGNDTLTGGAGADSLAGGIGHDTYVIDADDILVEGANEGSDTIKVTISHALGNNFEKLILTGTGSVNGTGNELANTLTGNSGANRLDGLLGSDTLTGGGGADVFAFTTPLDGSIDTIKSFGADDVIELDNAIFTSLTSTGALATDNFLAAATAGDYNDFILYDQTTGALYYDADGDGGGAKIQFATLWSTATAHPLISAADFLVS